MKSLKKNLTTKIQHKNIYLVEKQIFDDEMVPVGLKLPVSLSFVGKSMILSGECQNVSVPSINNSFPSYETLVKLRLCEKEIFHIFWMWFDLIFIVTPLNKNMVEDEKRNLFYVR